ncbi:MAG TPA: hypothetical protein VFF65_03800 [Phycisphaerales bacterium]|nr:hypothetical protein [Phycisphaerales bacterium]
MGLPPIVNAWLYVPAAILALLGVLCLYMAFFRDRARGRQRCRSCWYDMRGANSLPARCPECGTQAQSAKELRATRRHYLWLLPALPLLAPLPYLFYRLHATTVYYALMPRWKLELEERSGATTVRIYAIRNPDERGGRVVVKSAGATLIDHEDAAVRALSTRKSVPDTILEDVNRDGVPDVVISCYSGGAHCCSRVYIFEARPAGAALVADIDSHSGVALHVRPGVAERLICIPDHSFEYWKAPSATSPRPLVYYRLENGALRIDLSQMRLAMSPPEADALANESAVVTRSADGEGADPVLWRTMLSLIFAGHEPQAWVFFNRHWPGDAAGKEAFRKEFLQVLATDPWYQDLTAALAAEAAGKPIPPSIVGMSGQNLGAADTGR